MGRDVYDLVISANASFRLPLTWTNRNGTPKPLTSYDARMQIREDPESEEALVEVSSEPDDGIILAEAGDIDVFIDSAKTAALLPYRGRTLAYDIVLVMKTDPLVKELLMRGEVQVLRGVTR